MPALSTRRFRWRLAAAVVPVALLAAACGDGGSPSDKDGTSKVPAALESYFPGIKATGTAVRIGLINPEGGTVGDLPENREAADAARRYANEQLGGIAGHPIEFVVCKIKEDPASSRDCANQMVEAKVSAVVVTVTAQGDSMVPTITGAGIPYIASSGVAPSEFASPHVYLWTGGLPGVLVSIARLSKGLGYKKVSVLAIDLPAVIGGVKQLAKPAFTALGITLSITPLPLGAADNTPQVSTAEKGSPDAHVILGDAAACIGALKALQALGSTTPVLGTQPCADDNVLEAVGSALEGAKIFTPFEGVSDHLEAQLYRYVMARYAPKTNATGFAGVGYEGALTLFRALKDASDVTAAGLDSALKAAKDVPIAAGHGLKATCNGKQFPTLTAICSTGSIVSTVKQGKLTETTAIP